MMELSWRLETPTQASIRPIAQANLPTFAQGTFNIVTSDSIAIVIRPIVCSPTFKASLSKAVGRPLILLLWRAAAFPRRLRPEAESSVGAEPDQSGADVGAESASGSERIPQPQRQCLDLLEADAALLAPSGGCNAAGEHALDDGDRCGEEGAGVDRAFRAEPRLEIVSHARKRRVRFRRAAGEPNEPFGVEPFLAEAGEKRPQAGARKTRVGVGRIVDEGKPARPAKGDEV